MNVSALLAPGASLFAVSGAAQRHSPTDHHYAITTILKSWTSVRGLI
jgi:hypothetical protein